MAARAKVSSAREGRELVARTCTTICALRLIIQKEGYMAHARRVSTSVACASLFRFWPLLRAHYYSRGRANEKMIPARDLSKNIFYFNCALLNI